MEKIKQIQASSRISFKQKTVVGDVFYTFEYGETVEVDTEPNEDYEQVKSKMWERIDNEVKNKCNEVLNKQQ